MSREPDEPDRITRNKFGRAEWAPDGSGLYYARYDEPASGEELTERTPPPDVCFHRLGTPVMNDAVVHPRPTEEGISLGRPPDLPAS